MTKLDIQQCHKGSQWHLLIHMLAKGMSNMVSKAVLTTAMLKQIKMVQLRPVVASGTDGHTAFDSYIILWQYLCIKLINAKWNTREADFKIQNPTAFQCFWCIQGTDLKLHSLPASSANLGECYLYTGQVKGPVVRKQLVSVMVFLFAPT